MIRNLIPCIYLQKKRAVTGFGQKNVFSDGDPVRLSAFYSENGADALLVFDFSNSDEEHDEAIDCLKDICRASQIPVLSAGHINRLEDVKKLLYAGCRQAVLNGSKESNIRILKESSERFGRDRIAVCVSDYGEYEKNRSLIDSYAGRILLFDDNAGPFEGGTNLPVVVLAGGGSEDMVRRLLENESVEGVSGYYISDTATDLNGLKSRLRNEGVPVNILVSSLSFDELRTDSAGLIPCVVQDYRTDEVLMVAWMNRESFQQTLLTGRMTYFSRSRKKLWIKGETSGHFQYVKSLLTDCDRDTLLARVSQIGAACHTGNRTCFFTTLAEKEDTDTNPYRVFEKEMAVILERKENPKEGSYTNYLFEKGIDKILKKVGEENTEIIIAAKNPNPEEIKYEIADYLYHLMVLMAEKGVTWEEVTEEIARR